MTKIEFLSALEQKLSGLPADDRQRSMEFYGEIIDDRIEDGIPEEEAIKEIGSPDEIVDDILATVSLPKIVKEKVTPKRKLAVWEMVLLVLGSPVWLPLALAVIAVLLSVYIVLWSVILSFYTVTAALGISGAACLVGTVLFAVRGEIYVGLLAAGAGLVCVGLAILVLLLSNLTAKAILRFSKYLIVKIKRCVIGKETAI